MTNVNDRANRGPVTIAAFDLGSNSIKMTVATTDAAAQLHELMQRSETVRIGQGIDKTGKLADDRIEAALDTLTRFANEAREAGASRLIGVATEAVRVAVNGESFLEDARSKTGIEFQTISGDREAHLTFTGLTGVVDLSGKVAIADIGGASTEIIVALEGRVSWSKSFPLGSGRLTDQLVRSDPPLAKELLACRAEANRILAEVPFDLVAGGRSIVVGGTGEYLDRLVPHDVERNDAALDAILDRLAVEPAAELAETLSIAVARARVLPAGVAIARGIADRMKPSSFLAAQSGIRRGLLLSAFAGEI